MSSPICVVLFGFLTSLVLTQLRQSFKLSWTGENTMPFLPFMLPIEMISHLDSESEKKFETNNTLPLWILRYIDWHNEKRRQLTKDNWNDTQYAVVSCRTEDRRCGGASDRLHALPWNVLIAAKSNRLLLYHWERPCNLEEFFYPVSVDWTVPEWLWDNIKENNPMTLLQVGQSLDPARNFRDRPVLLKLQSNNHGSKYYNSMKSQGEPSFQGVYKDLWNIFFQPSEPINTLMHETMQSLGISPGNYVAAHLRQKYVKDRSRDMWNVENQVKCAYRQNPNVPVYFASDSQKATRHAVDYGKTSSRLERTVKVVGRESASEPLHLDRGTDYLSNNYSWKNTNASQYYDVFADLLLLMRAKCVVYGHGGYGQWASLFTTGECTSYRQARGQPCGWNDTPYSAIAEAAG